MDICIRPFASIFETLVILLRQRLSRIRPAVQDPPLWSKRDHASGVQFSVWLRDGGAVELVVECGVSNKHSIMRRAKSQEEAIQIALDFARDWYRGTDKAHAANRLYATRYNRAM